MTRDTRPKVLAEALVAQWGDTEVNVTTIVADAIRVERARCRRAVKAQHGRAMFRQDETGWNNAIDWTLDALRALDKKP